MRRCTIAAGQPAATHDAGRRARHRSGTRLAMQRSGVRAVLVLVGLAVALRTAHAVPLPVASAGDPSPFGLPFSAFSGPALDDRGHLAFVGSSTALFVRTAAGLVHRLGAGDLVAGRTVSGVGTPVLAVDGCVVLRAGFVGGGAGIIRECAGMNELVVATGLGTADGRTLVGLANEVAVGSSGRIAFGAVLDDRSGALYVADTPGTFTEVVRTGTPSPAGGTFTSVHVVGVSSAGRVGFRAATAQGPDGLFVWNGASVVKVVGAGDPSPAGGAFTTIGLGAMNDDETWTFRASVSSGGGHTGVFRASLAAPVATIVRVVLDGDPAPGGGTFKTFPTSLVPAINAAGAVAFRAPLAEADASAAVVVGRPDGTLAMALSVGDETPVGDLIRLREVALGDDGAVVVRATVAGGAVGIFRSTPDGAEPMAMLGEATDLGAAFRFSDASVRGRAEDAVFLGTEEGLFTADAPGQTRVLARLGDRTPVGGQYTRFDPPAAFGGKIVFGAGIQGGRVRDVLLAARAPRPAVLVKGGQKIHGIGHIVALFANPLDDLAHAAVGPGGIAFQASLSDRSGASGILFWSGGRVRDVVRDGDAAPGGGRYVEFGTPAVGAGGTVTFVARTGETATSLFRASGGGTTAVARWGARTGTRITGVFRGFDTPAAAASSVAFRAVLDQSRQAVFLARGRCRMALAGTGEHDAAGGRFTSFGAPTFANGRVVFRANVSGGAAPVALYRATPAGPCTRIPPALEAIAVAGASTPYLDFGPPAGNRRGALVFAADLTGAGPGDAVLFLAR